jgi:hypothetical protein
VYVISTIDAQRDRITAAALERLTRRTGGKLYLADNWQAQAAAFTAIREDLGASYTAYYYPAPNPNAGFRQIKIELVSPKCHGYRIRTRDGYQAHASISKK